MDLDFPKIETKILKFWQEKKIFEKLRKKNQGQKRWSFLDGPITANNPMGVHHAWGRTYKDLFQRYKAMQGYDQRFQNGFDCQGLWVEVEVEKELGFKTKKDIEKYGIAEFIEKCKERVRKYSKIQTAQSLRLGQWMDWENSYYTMSDENNYAIWQFLKKCWQGGQVRKGRDAIPWCPRCETAISQHEILTEDYKEVTHESIYLEFPIAGRQNEFLLVWTTTPWTIPANIAVAVDEKLDYSLVEGNSGDFFWLAKDLIRNVFKVEELRSSSSSFSPCENSIKKYKKIIKTVKGKELIGLKYRGPFDNLDAVRKVADENQDKFHLIIATDERIMPISIDEGTGLVHIAVSAGEEDFKLGQKYDLPIIPVIADNADYLPGFGDFSGKNAKNNPRLILDYLMEKEKTGEDWVFKIAPYVHRYPVCWRCKTELVWKVADEWYISMDKLRGQLAKAAKKIKWIPSFGLDRELDWLKNMHDWLISKKRYWGLALPIFECKKCNNFEVIGSKEELEAKAVSGWEQFKNHSPHRPWIDEVKIKCSKCGAIVSRIPDVGNPWLDAGIVPFSTMGYFSDKRYWQKWFPADFICESFPGQFKNWFYSLIVMSAVLEGVGPAKTIFGHAMVRDEKGEEMHKSKGNAIWFDEAVEKIGAEPMRWMYAKSNPAHNLLFGYKSAEEIKRKLLTLWNNFIFFKTYSKTESLLYRDEVKMSAKKSFSSFVSSSTRRPKSSSPSSNILDKWIVSCLNNLIEKVTKNLNEYNAAVAVAIEDFFIEDLSLWYIRRSRKRFQKPKNDKEKKEAVQTLRYVLLNLIKLIAPMMPFLSEEIYQNLKTKKLPESVHLCDWPEADKKFINEKLEKQMQEVREIAAKALAERAKTGIKVRQPLASLKIKSLPTGRRVKNDRELLELIKEEVNIKEIIFDSKIKNEVELDTKITPELKEEGIIREIIRNIQDLRKKAGLKPENKILVVYSAGPKLNKILERNKKFLLAEAKVKDLICEDKFKKSLDAKKDIMVDKEKLLLAIKKVG
ncbi:MAG: isoleucine--tRNA ligase [bacterium]|nr:isoleucine--tRNA ligase [bacterium]